MGEAARLFTRSHALRGNGNLAVLPSRGELLNSAVPYIPPL
jgi:hypothetical protein